MSPPKITVFYTGGTISMTHAAVDGTAVPTLTGADICKFVPELQGFQIHNVDFGQLPGPHMALERGLALAQQIQAAVQSGACDGVVVTHGTDTIEETSFLLDMLHHSPLPVVVVGAMRTSDELSWDGPVNLFSGCLVASDPRARERGVMVVMNNTINAASEVTKTYTEAIDTFVSPDTGPVGIVDLQRVLWYRRPVYRPLLPRVERAARVELIEATAGCDGGLVEAAVSLGAEGLVVAAMGRGNMPPAMADAVYAAMRKGVQVVVVSRCWGGRVAPIYGYPGGGARLLEAGALFAPWLNGPKARIALSLALAAHYSHAQLRVLFEGPP